VRLTAGLVLESCEKRRCEDVENCILTMILTCDEKECEKT
jgi:hypothetical protein